MEKKLREAIVDPELIAEIEKSGIFNLTDEEFILELRKMIIIQRINNSTKKVDEKN